MKEQDPTVKKKSKNYLCLAVCIISLALVLMPLGAYVLDYHWLIIIPLLIFFKIYVNDSVRLYDPSKDIFQKHILNKEFTTFSVMLITTSSLLFAIFSNVFFENKKIIETIKYSLLSREVNLNEFTTKIDNRHAHFCFDLSGSWEDRLYPLPDWYKEDEVTNLASQLNLNNITVATDRISALELAKIKALFQIKNLMGKIDYKISVLYYRNGKLLSLTDNDGNVLIDCKNKSSVRTIAEKLYGLEKSNSKTDFVEIFRQINSKIPVEGAGQTVVMFSDFIHYNPGKNRLDPNFDFYLNQLYLKNVSINCVKSNLVQTVPETEKNCVDLLMKRSILRDRITIRDLLNGTHPNDLLNDIEVSLNDIEFYYGTDYKSNFKILASGGSKTISVNLVEPSKYNSGLFYSACREDDECEPKMMEPNKRIPISDFNGEDYLLFAYDGGPLDNPPRHYVLEVGIKGSPNSRNYKINTVFLKKIPEWAAILFFVNAYFLALTFLIRLSHIIYHLYE